MPKTLKKARRSFFATKRASSSEESLLSNESEEYSHVPIDKEEIVDLSDNLTRQLVAQEQHIEETNMEQINSHLEKMMQMMNSFAAKQNEHDTMFKEIENRLNGTTASTSAETTLQIPPQANLDQLFKIPDPIKMIPTFDGNPKQLNHWLTTVEETLNALAPHVSPAQYKMYITAVTNKIHGKAKDIICLANNLDNFEDIKEILKNSLGDRQELSTYKCQLWQFRMTDGMSIAKYYHRSKEIVHNIKTLAKQNQKYKMNWDVINDFIDEDALAAFVAGLKEPYFGYAQAAKPKDTEDAYAFLCMFKSKEITVQSMASNTHQKRFQKDYNPKTTDMPHQSNRPYNQNNKIPKQEPQWNGAEPMEANTTRSRLTINRKTINNHEMDNENETSSESEEDEIDVNFLEAATPSTTT